MPGQLITKQQEQSLRTLIISSPSVVEVNYNEPNQPGFSLHAWWIKTPFTSDGLLPKVDHPHFSVVAPFAPEHLPCPGAAADANCTMAYFPIVISYNGGGLNMTTTLSA
jgi:hypothetical protein